MPLDPSHGYPATPLHYLETQGRAGAQADAIIQAVDATMRAAYDAHIARVGNNIYPLLYVDFTLVGGRYTLVESESRSHVRAPDLRTYAQLKSTAHIPLGIFVQISEYAAYPDNGQWIPPIQAYRQQLAAAQAQIDRTAMVEVDRSACHELVAASIQFIDGIVGRRTFTLDEFRAYTHGLRDAILHCARKAAQVQVDVMSAVVAEFKQILGARWSEVYVVISALWTLSQENAHALIIGNQMSPERRETHLIVSEAVPTLDAARQLLGRIVGDRIVAQYVFSQDGSRAEREDIYSLSTRRDLLSQAIEQVIDTGEDKPPATR
jgi:hypothetical protein